MRQLSTYVSQDFLALHGSYGLDWLFKDMTFPGSNWQKRIPLGGGINAFLFVL